MADRRRPPRAPHLARVATVLLLAGALLASGCALAKRCAYEGFGRDTWQQPERVIADLGLAPGARVADLGSGGGYFSFGLARAVGPRGRVYAVDVDPDMTAYVAREAAAEHLTNLSPVLAAPDDPHLPERVDLVFTSNTYHHLGDRVRYFREVRERYLVPGGRVAIVEFKPEETSHSTPRETIETEMTAAGFHEAKAFDYLERQHFLVFVAGSVDPEQAPR